MSSSASLPGVSNVVQVFGAVLDSFDRRPRIVMELCPYGCLRSYIRSLSTEQARPWLWSAAIGFFSLTCCWAFST